MKTRLSSVGIGTRMLALLAALGCAGCGTNDGTPTGDPGAIADVPATDAVVDKSAACASTFGSALTKAFGRLDGTVLAVVGPTDRQCKMPNDDHLVVQVLMGGDAYRMVVNVRSDHASPDVFLASVAAPVPSPAWSEGWHPGAQLDYVRTLGVHANAFTSLPMDALVAKVTDRLVLGAHVSVYATSSGGTYAHSAHLVHRNRMGEDGAIVVDPDSADPLFLLFRFAYQSF